MLRGAARELGSAASQPGTPRAQGAGGGDGDIAAAPPSTAHLLLQISALHKAFLALSEAFMEEISQRGVEREEQRAAVESVRRECFAKLQVWCTCCRGMALDFNVGYGKYRVVQAVPIVRGVQWQPAWWGWGWQSIQGWDAGASSWEQSITARGAALCVRHGSI